MGEAELQNCQDKHCHIRCYNVSTRIARLEDAKQSERSYPASFRQRTKSGTKHIEVATRGRRKREEGSGRKILDSILFHTSFGRNRFCVRGEFAKKNKIRFVRNSFFIQGEGWRGVLILFRNRNEK